MGRVQVFRFDDGDAATSYAEAAVAVDEPVHALAVLVAHGIDPHQLWDRGRTPCTVPLDDLDTGAAAALRAGSVLVRRHDLDGVVTGWRPARASLDRRRQPRSRFATSTAQ